MRLVGAYLRELREAEGHSLGELARRAELHRTSVGLALRGERGLTLASADALARACGQTLSALVLRAEAELKPRE
jgi:transcriptional regulator with XRE-family HTH domain